MKTCTHTLSATSLHTYERGGLTSTPSPHTSAVSRFDYCEQCDIEVPVDGEGLCAYCFHAVPENDE